MNKQVTYYGIAIFFLLNVLGCNNGKVQMPSLRETYSSTDKNPFGGYAAYRFTEQLFPLNSIREKKQSFDKTWHDIEYNDTASLYICITPKLFVNKEEIKIKHYSPK